MGMAILYNLYSVRYCDGSEHKNLVARGDDINYLKKVMNQELRSGYVDCCRIESVRNGVHSRVCEKWAE